MKTKNYFIIFLLLFFITITNSWTCNFNNWELHMSNLNYDGSPVQWQITPLWSIFSAVMLNTVKNIYHYLLFLFKKNIMWYKLTRTTKKVLPFSLYLSMMLSICLRMSWALFRERPWMKFSKHQGLENLLFFQEL